MFSVTKKQYHHRSASKKKRDIARIEAFRPKKIEIEEPSITVTNEIDMVNESIPMVEIEIAELNRLKQETESYWAKLNKRNEEIYELHHQKEVLEKEKKAEKFNFMSLSEKKINFYFDIGNKTFKWMLGRTKPHVNRYHLQLNFEDFLYWWK